MRRIMFNYEDVLEAVNEVVREVGEDYRYPDNEKRLTYDVETCSYLSGDNPSCLVARAVRKLIPDAEFEEGEPVSTQPWNEALDTKASAFLQKAQILQDLSAPWGEVVDRLTRYTVSAPWDTEYTK